MLALAAGSCVDSGNRGWDLGHWSPPLVESEQVEAYRGVHEGRIGVSCIRGGEPRLFIETWRPLTAEEPSEVTMSYRLDGREHAVAGQLSRSRFVAPASADLIAELSQGSSLEALIPVDGGGVYPVTFDVGDFTHALEWVRTECAQLSAMRKGGS